MVVSVPACPGGADGEAGCPGDARTPGSSVSETETETETETVAETGTETEAGGEAEAEAERTLIPDPYRLTPVPWKGEGRSLPSDITRSWIWR